MAGWHRRLALPLPVHFPRTRQATVLALTVGLALVGCGGGTDGDGSAAPSTTAPPSTAVAPTPEPSADPRSPEALVELLDFQAPPQQDPAVQAGIDGYEEFLRQFVIAEGLGDPDYPPLLALINPRDQAFVDGLLSGLTIGEKDNTYVLGPLAERVTDAAGNASRVLIDTCTDYTGRDVYSEATDEVVGKLVLTVIRARVVMTRAADGWILSDYSAPNEQNCT